MTPAWRHRYVGRALIALVGATAAFAAHALWGDVALIESTKFPFRALRVEGTFEHVTAPQLTAVVAPYAADGFFKADVRAIKQALEDLPWVYQASVRRVWPDVLHVTVTEESAVARWQEEGLVNREGRVFYPPERDVRLQGLPLLQGPPRTSVQVMNAYVRLNEQLAPVGLRIACLSMDARRSWRLALDNGMKLTLGRKDSERQLERFVRFYSGTLDGRIADVEEVDLRYTSGFAVRWRMSRENAARGPGAKNTGDTV